jgi:hypothetical protein
LISFLAVFCKDEFIESTINDVEDLPPLSSKCLTATASWREDKQHALGRDSAEQKTYPGDPQYILSTDPTSNTTTKAA